MIGSSSHVRFHDLGGDPGFAAGTFEGLMAQSDGTLFIDDVPTCPEVPPLPLSGAWISPVIETGFPASEAVLSWHANTPTGTWIEASFRARQTDGSWSGWFLMCRWASGDDFTRGDIRRTTIDGQSETAGRVLNDTFVAAQHRPFDAYQVRVELVRPAGSIAPVALLALYAMVSAQSTASPASTSTFSLEQGVQLDVPCFSQMIHLGQYPSFAGGGAAWCSPTSTSMVLYYWGLEVAAERLASVAAPQGDPHIISAVRGVYDYGYDGAGNWAFNAAYAAEFGLRAFVTRLRSLVEAEVFLARGIPLIVSVSFGKHELPQAGFATNGHLLVISGFTPDGDVLVNDPGAPSNSEVHRVYDRASFESVWLQGSNGTTYVFHPPTVPLPQPGAEPNW